MLWNLRPRTPKQQLFEGARLGTTNLIRSALASGLPVDTLDAHQRTALCVATKYNQVEAIRLLVESGADPNFRLPSGKTPIFAAIQYGTVDTIQLLISLGASVEVRDALDMTPYDFARAKLKLHVCDFLKLEPEES
jgi:ankyrin repeat protein